MTHEQFTKADVKRAADNLAKEKMLREPERFNKIADPHKRLAAARSEVWQEYPVLAEADGAAR